MKKTGEMVLMTGLSRKNAIEHMLQGETQSVIQNIWKEFERNKIVNKEVQLCELVVDQIESMRSIVNVFEVLMRDKESSCEACAKNMMLPVDMARCFIVYFTHVNQLRMLSPPLALSPGDMLDCFTSICVQVLEDNCNEKHMDCLATSLPSVASMIGGDDGSKEGRDEICLDFIHRFLKTLCCIAASYSNSKKIFLLCCSQLLSPCMDIYDAFLKMKTGAMIYEILADVDSLIAISLFDDLNNVRDISLVPFESIERRCEQSDQSGNDKGKSKTKKKHIVSYHVEFYLALAKWVSSQPAEMGDKGLDDIPMWKPINRLIKLFVQASRAFMNNNTSDLSSKADQTSYVVKWRLHVKRLLHSSINLTIAIRSFSSPAQDNDNENETRSILACSSVFDSVSVGLRDDDRENKVEGERESGAIPNHDSMTPYIEYMKNIGVGIVNGIFESARKARSQHLFANILFLEKLFTINYRAMLDALPEFIRVICLSCNEAATNGKNCRLITELLLCKLLKLYSEIRNLDVLLRTLLTESLGYPWSGNNLVEQFYSLLLNIDTQTLLIAAISSMPDAERKLLWEAIYTESHAFINCNIESLKRSDGLFSPTYCFVIEAILLPFAVAQEYQNHRPIPVHVLTNLLKGVFMMLDSAIDSDDPVQIDVASILQLIAAVFHIGGERLSSLLFSHHIFHYPYDMVYDTLPDRINEKKTCAEKEWIEFCDVATSLVGSVYKMSRLSMIFTVEKKKIANQDNIDEFCGAMLASLVKIVCTSITLFSSCSDSLSPVMRHVEKNSDDSDGALFPAAYSIIQNDGVLDMLRILSSYRPDGSFILSSFPILCNMLVTNFSKWGYIAENILHDHSASDMRTVLKNIFVALLSSIMVVSSGVVDDENSIHSQIIISLTNPNVEELPIVKSIIMQAVGFMFEDILYKSELRSHYMKKTQVRKRKSKKQSNKSLFDDDLLRFEMTLLRFPIDFLCEIWEDLFASCFRVLYLLSHKYSYDDKYVDADKREAVLATASLKLILDITQEKLSNLESRYTTVVSLLQLVLDNDVSGEAKVVPTCFLKMFPSFQKRFFTSGEDVVHQEVCAQLQSLVGLIFQCGCGTLLSVNDSASTPKTEQNAVLHKYMTLLLKSIGVGFADKDMEEGFSSSWATYASVVLAVAMSIFNNGNVDHNISDLFMMLLSVLSNLASSLQQRKHRGCELNSEDIAAMAKTGKCLERLIEQSVECLENSEITDYDFMSHCRVVAESYTLLCNISVISGYSSEGEDGVSLTTLNSIESILKSNNFCRKKGWLFLLGAYLSGQNLLDVAGTSYLKDVVSKGLVRSMLECIDRIFFSEINEATGKGDNSVVSKTISLILHATLPADREEYVAIPLLDFVNEKIRFLSQREIYHNYNEGAFIALLNVVSSVVDIGNEEWRTGSKEQRRGLKICHDSYKKTIIHRSCDELLAMCTYFSTICCDNTHIDVFSGEWNYGFVLDTVRQLLQMQFKLELQQQFEISQSNRKRKRNVSDGEMNQSDSTNVGKLFDTSFVFLAMTSSRLVYMSLRGDHDVSLTTVLNFKNTVCGVITLLNDVLACITVPVINSYIGSVVLILRQLLCVVSSVIITSSESNNGTLNDAGKEMMALLGRSLMAAASSRHLQKHCYLIVSAIIDAISGISSSTTVDNDFSVRSEVLREHLFPGIFALFDKCRNSRERKQIFASLRDDNGSRALYTDLHTIYQQDFKFIGKA